MNSAALFLCFAFGAARCAAAAEAVRVPAGEMQRSRIETIHHPAEAQRWRVCFSPSETREKILSRHLREPFQVLRRAAGGMEGEALRVRLCRWSDDFVYEIAMLRRDGHVVYAYLNALDGHAIPAFGGR